MVSEMTEGTSLANEFNITGKLVKIIFKKYNQVKYLKLVNEKQAYWIKVDKSIREDIAEIVSLDTEVTIKGTKKPKKKTGEIEYKAEYVKLVANSNSNPSSSIIVPETSSLPKEENKVKAKAKAKILVCKKSSCWKKGGKEICQVLENIYSDRSIEVKTTGCLKQCKQGPNIIMLPDKARYSRVKPKQIPTLVEKHLLTKSH